MVENVRIFAKWVPTKENKFADWLSRDRLDFFQKVGCGKFDEEPMEIPHSLWPIEKLWIKP